MKQSRALQASAAAVARALVVVFSFVVAACSDYPTEPQVSPQFDDVIICGEACFPDKPGGGNRPQDLGMFPALIYGGTDLGGGKTFNVSMLSAPGTRIYLQSAGSSKKPVQLTHGAMTSAIARFGCTSVDAAFARYSLIATCAGTPPGRYSAIQFGYVDAGDTRQDAVLAFGIADLFRGGQLVAGDFSIIIETPGGRFVVPGGGISFTDGVSPIPPPAPPPIHESPILVR